MTTQKTFKRGVRARMAKTGESYAAARTQLVRKADARGASADTDASSTGAGPAASEGAFELPTSDDAVRTATGRGWDEWFAILDAWGAAERRHPEIARWLVSEHGVGGWWAQSVTGGYERARGLRAKHQMSVGYAISANRTVAAPADVALEAFTSAAIRRRWLPVSGLRRRPTRAAYVARFDWPDLVSRIAVYVSAAGDRKARVSVQHEHLPDAESADRMKRLWRERLSALKAMLESELR